MEEWLSGLAKRKKHRTKYDGTEPGELAEAIINKLRGTFSMLYKHGNRKDLVEVNPAGNVPLKKIGEGIERYLSYDEEDRLRAVLQADIDNHAGHEELRKQAVQRMLEFEVSMKSGMRRVSSTTYGGRTWISSDASCGCALRRTARLGTPT